MPDTSEVSRDADLKPEVVAEGLGEIKERDAVSTHVLVEENQVEKLRELSKRTRIAQSEYLREAVDDLLAKYRKEEEER
jgi:hypothetical protein